ncbi:MAG: ribonuclease Z [Thermodesulfobacteriota bacterium]
MRLTILGSGTCVPYHRRGSSSYALELPKSTILLDCGNGATWKLGKVGINYLDIDHILITHFHPDHTSDLIPFLFATRYSYGSTREKPLHLWGPPGFKGFFSALKEAYSDWIVPQELLVNDIEYDRIQLGDFVLRSAHTLHTENSLAYRIDSERKSLVYTGDTDYSESLVKLAENADILLIECSMPDDLKVEGHLTPAGVIRIANESGAKKIILTHLYPACDERDILDSIINEVYAEVIVAEDFLEIDS